MRPPKATEALRRAARLLERHLSEHVRPARKPPRLMDAQEGRLLEAGKHRFVVDWRRGGALAEVALGIDRLDRLARRLPGGWIRLLAVPYMGDVGRVRCEEAGCAWVDLSGNAHVEASGLRIHVVGHPNRFRSPGRPANLFAPKSARIVRWLLIHPDRWLSQRELAEATHVDEGLTSRIARRLEELQLIERSKAAQVRPRDPDVLLDAWRENYDFGKHEIIRAHLAARSGEEAVRTVASRLAKRGVAYAATGLAAAWMYTPEVGFRIGTVYVGVEVDAELLEELGAREETAGANLWIVRPNDEGVFHGKRNVRGVVCAHPVQVYVDLKGHPERAEEAARALRKNALRWRRRGR